MAGSRRLLFVSVPMHGHINPLLQPASLLAKQGHDVLFLCYEQLRATVEKAGIAFKSLGPDCIDRKQQLDVDTYDTKKTKMLAAAALYTGAKIGGLAQSAAAAGVPYLCHACVDSSVSEFRES